MKSSRTVNKDGTIWSPFCISAFSKNFANFSSPNVIFSVF